MTDTETFHDRRLRLEAGFDGSIPKHRLMEPAPPRKPAEAGTVMQSIASRRRALTANAAKADETLNRLTQYLHWLVVNDRPHA